MDENEALLMLAAKAEGREPPIDINGVFSAWVGSVENGHWWNPLTDDGDALRLAIKLKIRMNPESDGRSLVEFFSKDRWRELGNSSKECAAENMRRAIVRAAAEIGRQL